MPIKLKKTNIQYDLETPEKGWIILGVDEDGNLVKKDENGTYEKIVKDETYGIYLRLETDYLTIGNRITDSVEGLYSFVQGNQAIADKIYSTSVGLYSHSTGDYSYSRGSFILADKAYSYAAGSGWSVEKKLKSSGLNSFVHSFTTSDSEYGAFSDYSAILGGTNNLIKSGASRSVIIGGNGNIINNDVTNSAIISSNGITALKNNTIYTTNIKNIGDIETNILDSNIVNTIQITGETAWFNDRVITKNIQIVNNNGEIIPGYVRSNGNVDTNTYLKTTGGPSSKLTGNLVMNKGVTFTNLTTEDSNLIIGYQSLNFVDTNYNLAQNVILGPYNAQRLSGTSSNNVVIGSQSGNIVVNTLEYVASFNNNILIGSNIKLSGINSSNNEIIIGNNNDSRGNNTVLLGNSSTISTYLMGEIYQNSASIHPSDKRIKTKIKKLTDSEIKAAIEISKEIGLYNFLLDVKNGNNKKHVGLTVQRVIEILNNNNLNPDDYDFIKINNNFDKNLGTYLKDNKIYGFNYSELTLFIVAGIEYRLSKLETI